jgi:regulator of protease activity HflC (stomatin/prohibitin superfamily)
MIWFTSIILATILCGAAFLVGRAIRREAEPRTPESDRGLIIMAAAAVLWLLWAGIHTGFASTKQIEAGHVAIVYQFGEIVGQKGEGLQFIAPWQSIRTENIRVQRARFENINAFSQETQDVFINATVNYSVSPGAVQNLYRTVGPNWFDTLVQPRINNYFKEEVVKFQTVDVAPNRESIRQTVRSRLDLDLQQFSVTVNDLLIDDIDFRPEFKEAIEQKQIATQDALREQERIEQRRAEAQQAIEVANGEAEAIKIRADAQASANEVIGKSLTDQVIQFAAVQSLSDNIQIALIPSGAGILLDPATLIGTSAGTGSVAPSTTTP